MQKRGMEGGLDPRRYLRGVEVAGGAEQPEAEDGDGEGGPEVQSDSRTWS